MFIKRIFVLSRAFSNKNDLLVHKLAYLSLLASHSIPRQADDLRGSIVYGVEAWGGEVSWRGGSAQSGGWAERPTKTIEFLNGRQGQTVLDRGFNGRERGERRQRSGERDRFRRKSPLDGVSKIGLPLSLPLSPSLPPRARHRDDGRRAVANSPAKCPKHAKRAARTPARCGLRTDGRIVP